jgi:hypothetical protein
MNYNGHAIPNEIYYDGFHGTNTPGTDMGNFQNILKYYHAIQDLIKNRLSDIFYSVFLGS